LNPVQVGGAEVQDWDRTGVPPVQPAGEEPVTVRVWVPFAHAVQSVYVKDVHVTGAGSVQAWLVTGLPPVQPAGVESVTVRVWVPFAQALQAQ
jgi:hypothetical protein